MKYFEIQKLETSESTKVLSSYGELVPDDTKFGQWANKHRDKLRPLNKHFINNLIDGEKRFSDISKDSN